MPSGDQLDEEIIKIVKKRNLQYGIYYFADNCEVTVYSYKYIPNISNTNPLIAKIKLLLELLESEEK
ncbi:MAG: hypothetical protein ACTSPI_00875 [Candidatus Heimdallarchaeaceae archaeon]